MSPPPMFGQRDHILCCIGKSSQDSAVPEGQRSSQCLVEVPRLSMSEGVAHRWQLSAAVNRLGRLRSLEAVRILAGMKSDQRDKEK